MPSGECRSDYDISQRVTNKTMDTNNRNIICFKGYMKILNIILEQKRIVFGVLLDTSITFWLSTDSSVSFLETDVLENVKSMSI